MRRTIKAALCLLVLCGGLSAQTIVKSSGASGSGGAGTASDTEVLWNSAGTVDGVPGSSWDGTYFEIPNFVVGDMRCTAAAGVLTCQDPTAGTGITTFTIKGGAGQGATDAFIVEATDGMDYFTVNSAGSRLSGVTEVGAITMLGWWRINGSSVGGINFGSGHAIAWGSAATNNPTSGVSGDTGLARSAAGVVRVTDGSTGYGQAYAKSFRANPDGTSRPTCDSSARGTYWQTYGGAGVADTVAVCAKDAADAYDWRVIY